MMGARKEKEPMTSLLKITVRAFVALALCAAVSACSPSTNAAFPSSYGSSVHGYTATIMDLD